MQKNQSMLKSMKEKSLLYNSVYIVHVWNFPHKKFFFPESYEDTYETYVLIFSLTDKTLPM